MILAGLSKRPLVTFALFAYKQEAYIQPAVAAALAQTYEPLEIILSDDGSPDRTYEIMQRMAAEYGGPHRVRLNRNDPNMGLSRHVNHVMAMASGDIVVVAAGDDISLPDRVRDSVAALQRHPGATMVSFIDEVIDDKGTTLHKPEATNTETVFDLDDFLAEGPLAQRKLRISGASRAIVESVFEQFGDLMSDCPAEDGPLIMRCLVLGKGVVCGWPAIRYRRHGHQLSTEDSIAKMDTSIFRAQYLQDIANAENAGILKVETARKVRRWIDESNLFFDIRKLNFRRQRPTLNILLRALGSKYPSPREKVGLFKQYLFRRPFIDKARRLKSHLSDAIRSPADYLRYVLGRKPRTDVHRWSNDSNFSGDWDGRTHLIARYISSNDRVAEFGAGLQALRAVLPEGCQYQPFDIVARTPDVRVCDLNNDLPSIAGEYDVAVFSGVLEYLSDLDAVFSWLTRSVDRIVFSYAVSDVLSSPLERSRNGWVNNISCAELIKLTQAKGFSCRLETTWRHHFIFEAHKR